MPPCWPMRASSRQTDARGDHQGPRSGRRRDRERQVDLLARARRRAHERREPAQGSHRHAGRAAAHGALAQRPGGDRFPAVRARAPRRRSTRRWRRCSWRSSRKAEAHAATVMPGFTHLQPAQPVTFGHHLLAYVEMLGRDRGRFADARDAAERVSAGLGGAGGHVVPDRPARDGQGARLRQADRQFARRRLRPRLRARDAGRGVDLRRAPVALRRGDRAVDRRRSSASSSCPTSSPPAPRSCRRSATRTPPS